MRLAIDFGNEGRAGYGRIHKSGCRDLADPETLRCVRVIAALTPADPNDITTPEQLVKAFNHTTNWEDYDEADIVALLAPCARSYRS